MKYDYDLVVVGSGPAGLAAGIAAGTRGWNAVLFERESVGGKLVNRHTIENLPGYPETTGPELRTTLVEQLGEVGGQIRLAAVRDVRPANGEVPTAVDEAVPASPDDRRDDGVPVGFEVETAEGTYKTRTIIIAAGSTPSRLDVPGAETYHGRGIFYCAMCDGPLYHGDTVAVSGGDDWALTDALYLTNHAARVIVVEEGARLSARESLREKIADHPAVEVRTDTEIRLVDGEEVLTQIELVDSNDGTTSVEPVDGLYVQHGLDPETSFLPDWIPKTDCGAIEVDRSLETPVPGLYAAGDVRHASPRTIVTAFSDGITACRAAARYLAE